MIDLKHVKKIYKSKSGSEVFALDDVNLSLGSSGLVFVVGKSGSGKSTLLNLLGGLDSASGGELLVCSRSIGEFSRADFDSYRNTYVGFVFQEFNILEQYNVYENIELALKLQDVNVERSNIDSLLERLGLNGLGMRKINELSGGQKQRVAIGRALIKEPKIILADEPTGNLDSSSSEQIFNILKDISKDKLVVVVSHDMESAEKYADRIIKIEDGKIVSDSNDVEELDDSVFELKKSKLPFSYALKMAVTSFKAKPGKLFMTILLTAMALIFMGLSVNCLLFDEVRLITNTMRDNDNYVYEVRKMEFKVDGSAKSFILGDNDLEEIRDITDSNLNISYSLYDKGENLSFEFGEGDERGFFYNKIAPYFKFIEVEDDDVMGKLIGRSPQKSNEIVVHKYFADYAIKYGIMDSNDELYFPKSYDEFIKSGRKLKLGKNKVVVVGIVDDDDSEFLSVKNGGNFESDDERMFFSENYSEKGSIIYVKGFVDDVKLEIDKMSLLNGSVIRNDSYQKYVSDMILVLNKEVSIITDSGITSINSLEKNQVILSIDSIRKFDSSFDAKFNSYLVNNSSKTEDEALNDFVGIYLKENIKNINICLSFSAIDYTDRDICSKLDIVGISLDEKNYISYKYIEEYEPKEKFIYSVFVYNNKTSKLRDVFSQMKFSNYNDDVNDEEFSEGIYYTYDVDNDLDIINVISYYKALMIYILIISLVFVLFSFLLFSNFISTSISYCKKEIGILRALGAREVDVVKIFGYESFIIGVLAWIVSIIGWFIVCRMLNNSLFGNSYFELNGIVMHPLIPIIMFIYTIFIALFVSGVSISRITKIKPIDAILNK